MDIEGNHAIEFRGPGHDEGTKAPLWLAMTLFIQMNRKNIVPVTIASISLVGGLVG